MGNSGSSSSSKSGSVAEDYIRSYNGHFCSTPPAQAYGSPDLEEQEETTTSIDEAGPQATNTNIKDESSTLISQMMQEEEEEEEDEVDLENDWDAAEAEDNSIAPDKMAVSSCKLFSDAEIRNVKEIGGGGFGKVLQGTLPGRKGKPVIVAVKVFRVQMTVKESYLAKLMRLKHRNVVSILGLVVGDTNVMLGVEGDCHRILLQYFPDGNLLNFLWKKENPQDYGTMGKLALDIIHGMEYLHSCQVVHGNLSARNVLIQRSISKHKTHYNAKIGDFGITQLALDLPPSMVRWLPKEVVCSKEAPIFTFSSDIWMFGVVLWEMWTHGAIPFGKGYSEEEIIDRFLNKGKSPLSVHTPYGCPKRIRAVMETIFKEDPSQRPSFEVLRESFIQLRAYRIDTGSGGATRGAHQTKKKDKPKNIQEETSQLAEGGQADFKKKQKTQAPKPPKFQGHRPPPSQRCRDSRNTRGTQEQGPPRSSSEIDPIPSAPPPYTAVPLPSHLQVSPPASVDFDYEIQRREKELQLLKVQQLREEFQRKQNEMQQIMQKMESITIVSTGSAATTPSLFSTSPQADPQAYSPPTPYNDGTNQSRGQGQGSGQSRGRSDKTHNSNQRRGRGQRGGGSRNSEGQGKSQIRGKCGNNPSNS